MSVTPPTIDACLREARLQLEKVGESAQLEGEILLAHALHCQRTTLRTWPEKTLSEEQLKHFQQLLARRIAGEPSGVFPVFAAAAVRAATRETRCA